MTCLYRIYWVLLNVLKELRKGDKLRGLPGILPPPPFINEFKGAQWLSGRVLDSRPTRRGFEPHWRHCVVVLEQDTFILA